MRRDHLEVLAQLVEKWIDAEQAARPVQIEQRLSAAEGIEFD
jgi:hypothetical protein